MNIKIKDFVLRPETASPDKFNLYRIVEGMYDKDGEDDDGKKHKKGDLRVYEKNVGYGFRLETAIHKIISYKLLDMPGIVELKTYLNEYKNLKEEIKKLLSV